MEYALRLKFIDTRMFKYIDWMLFGIILALVLLSFVAIASATADPIEGDDSLTNIISQLDLYYVFQQMTWFGIGLLAMFIVLIPDYHAIGEYYKWIYVLLIGLLVAVFLFGSTVNGTRGWFKIGTTGLQPSELGKVAIIIVMARMITNRTKGRDGGIKRIRDILPILGVFLVPFALILLQRDLGTALVYAFTFFAMLFIAKTSIKIITGLLLCVGVALPAGWFLLADFQRNRIYSFLGLPAPGLTPEQVEAARYQAQQAQTAAGSGQLAGKGLFTISGEMQSSSIPESHTDFIFASTTRALGFIGACLIILLYVLLIARAFYLATKAKDELGTLIITGVVAMTLFHIFENIGMNIGVMPITGIPLPFFSYGGSNLLTCMIAFGLVINVSMRRHRWGLHG
jgi:rod shape determining protein RodA